MISGIALAIQKSKGRRNIDARLVILLIGEVAIAMVRKLRMALMEMLLVFKATDVAIEGKTRWRQFGVIALAIGMIVQFVTPVILCVRSLGSGLSWTST